MKSLSSVRLNLVYLVGSLGILASSALFSCGSPSPSKDPRGAAGAEHDDGDGGSKNAESSGGTNSGEGSGGSETGSPSDAFMFGVDISSVPEAVDQGARYFDTDGIEKPLLELLANHGVNSVRLRTFVEPLALYGYAAGDGGASCIKTEAYCDLEHTLEFGQAIKAAGMGLVVDFHYSDNWADPGKQIIPEAWRDANSIEELAGLLKEYTHHAVSTLVQGGARPDVVQIGNEITPGMLIHVPTSQTDCWGNNSARNELNGSVANWENLAALLHAGIDAVEEVDPSIRTMVHLENTDHPEGAVRWMETAEEYDLQFDILGLSCYPAYQGPPSIWEETLSKLSARFPSLSFVIAEYGPEPEAVIDVISNVPEGRGVGAFRWEPTLSGAWGPAMFTYGNAGQHADAEQFATFDSLRLALEL